MKSLCIVLAAFLLPVMASAQIVDVRLKEEFDAEVEAKQAEDGPPAETRDEDKFRDAVERRKNRRSDALDERRRINANKAHIYSLAKTVVLPSHLGPFSLLRDLGRIGGVGNGGGGSTTVLTSSAAAARRVVPPKILTILFLEDASSAPDGRKPAHLREYGHTVIAPPLPQDDFAASVLAAESAFNNVQPDIVVGVGHGGAVAMNMNSGHVPLVLLSPAWKDWGTASTVKLNTIILHSQADRVVPFADSEELRTNSGLPSSSLVQVGNDHRLEDPASLHVMLQACLRLGPS